MAPGHGLPRPVIFFGIAMKGKPLGCVPFELFAKFQRQQKIFML